MSSGAGMNGRPRLSAAQTRALKELDGASYDLFAVFGEIRGLEEAGLIFGRRFEKTGSTLYGLTDVGRRVLKEEEERDADQG